MKIYKKLISVLFICFITHIVFGAEITIYGSSYIENNAACPKTEYGYWVEAKNNYERYEWKITGGHFIRYGQKVTELNGAEWQSVGVVWSNVAVAGNNAPTGTITVKVYFQNTSTSVFDRGSKSQPIKSLNDILPPAPTTANKLLPMV
jgi:hypothetical protein